MSLLDKFKSWMNAEDEADFPFESTGYGVRELEPMELVNSALSSVAANAKKWPDGVDLPDVVEVWLSAQDYEYYGPRRASCEKRIADAVIAYAEEEGALLERVPTVIMQVDPSLLLGDVRTQARFSNPDEPTVRPAAAKRAPEPARTGPVGGVKTQLFRPNAERPQPAAAAGCTRGAQAAARRTLQKQQTEAAGETRCPAANERATTSNNPRSAFGKAPHDDPAPTRTAEGVDDAGGTDGPSGAADAAFACTSGAGTPVFDPAAKPVGATPEFTPGKTPSHVAKLIDENRQIEVVDGDTVGCLRQVGEPAPAVALDASDYPYVSQRQASFSYEGGVWSLVSLGRNGTAVQRDGIWTELPDNVPFALRDGDRISFARSAPLTFSLS